MSISSFFLWNLSFLFLFFCTWGGGLKIPELLFLKDKIEAVSFVYKAQRLGISLILFDLMRQMMKVIRTEEIQSSW